MQQYELQKEFEKQEKLRHLAEADRKAYEEQLRQQKELHNKHERIQYPGNQKQLEEVWEKQDHMDPEDFNPKTFFMIHGMLFLVSCSQFVPLNAFVICNPKQMSIAMDTGMRSK